MYANFGVFAILYLVALCSVVVRLPRRLPPEAMGALATLAFLLGYGAVLSMIEDQMSSLFLGACAGSLWQFRVRHPALREAEQTLILTPTFAGE